MLNYLHVVLTRVWDIYTLLDAGYLDVGSNHGPIPPCSSPFLHMLTCIPTHPLSKVEAPSDSCVIDKNYTFQLMMAYPHDISTDACTHLWFLGRSTASNVQNSQYSLECCWRLLRQASASWMQRDLQCLICGHDSDFSGFFILCFADIPYSCFFCVRPFLNSLLESCERQTSSVSANWLT